MGSRLRCRVCGKAFTTSIALKQHLKSAHPGYYYGVRLGLPSAALIIVLLATFFLASQPAISTVEPTSPAIEQPTLTPTTSVEESEIQPIKAPSFKLPVIDALGPTGEELSLSDLEGKPVFIEFISPYCPYCRKMLPVINSLHERYGDEVVFLTIFIGYRDVEEVSELIEAKEIKGICLLDEDMNVFMKYFEVYAEEGEKPGTPTYIILGRDHRLVRRVVGAVGEEALDLALRSAI